MFVLILIFLPCCWAGSSPATGQRTSATESHGRVVNYAYDLLNRLTTETVSGVVNPGSASYTYDAVGNRLARNSNLPGILASSYAYDANDRLLSDVYDNNGNTRAASMVDPLSLLPQPVADQYDFENARYQHDCQWNVGHRKNFSEGRR